jgi:hypothetical protein
MSRKNQRILTAKMVPENLRSSLLGVVREFEMDLATMSDSLTRKDLRVHLTRAQKHLLRRKGLIQ